MQWKLPKQKTNQQESQARQKGNQIGRVYIWQRIGLGAICILICMGFVFRVYLKSFLWLPINMHSELKADYSVDELAPPLNIVQLELIRDAIRDQFLPIGTQDNGETDRFATLVSELQTPVATVTPLYTQTQRPTLLPTGTATATGTSTATTTATATQTELPRTATSLPTQIISTAIPKPTNTRPPVATSTKKPPTQIPPTQPPPTQPPPTQPPPTATKHPTPTRVPPTQPPYPKPTGNPYP